MVRSNTEFFALNQETRDINFRGRQQERVPRCRLHDAVNKQLRGLTQLAARAEFPSRHSQSEVRILTRPRHCVRMAFYVLTSAIFQGTYCLKIQGRT
jgi:hypothetical protein